MDTYEATRIVLSRIQSLDPDNASKIMGMLLIQDHGEKEMIRLAFGPESLLHSVVFKARKELGFASNSPPSPSPAPPFHPPNHHLRSLSRQNSSASPRLVKSSWGTSSSCFSDDLISPNSINNSSMNSSTTSPFYDDLIDEFQLQDQLSFLNDGSLSPNLGLRGADFSYPHRDLSSSPTGDAVLFPAYGGAAAAHRRSCSVSDLCLGSDDPAFGFGWKPCLYYARGYCKNGNSCRFLHGGAAESAAVDGGSQLLSPSAFPYSGLAANKCMDLLLQQQQSDSQRVAAALMMGEDLNKFGRSRLERNDFSMSPVSRQIYLTFPADSTFREEDVSNYFSIYGPVQDVRIPYQQKRMFGFVTFVYPETVKLILAKGNPHFVCDARVLVKPYKEKGKVPDKYRKQQIERGEFSACGSPTGLDSRDPYDLQLGGRMFGNNSQDLLWRRKMEEQAELQQAIDFQGRRMMGLQLLDLKRHNLHHHRALSAGAAAIPSPTRSPNFFNQTVVVSPFDRSSPESVEENSYNLATEVPATVVADQELEQAVNVTEKERESSTANGTEENGNGKEIPHQHEESDLPESLEHNLPDSPFASPKAGGDYLNVFNAANEAKENVVVIPAASSANNNLITSSLISPTTTLDMASFQSCYFQVPRFSSGHGAIGNVGP